MTSVVRNRPHFFIPQRAVCICLATPILFSSITSCYAKVEQPDDIAAQSLFQHYVERYIGYNKIKECHATQVVGAGHDLSFSSLCTFSGSEHLNPTAICADTMLGKFTLTTNYQPKPDWLASFSRKNCPPGG